MVDLAVAKEARGNHVGLNVVRSLIEEVPNANVFAITATTNIPSIRLKKQLEFKELGAPFRDRNGASDLQIFGLLRRSIDETAETNPA
jgi:hypothetical protein